MRRLQIIGDEKEGEFSGFTDRRRQLWSVLAISAYNPEPPSKPAEQSSRVLI